MFKKARKVTLWVLLSMFVAGLLWAAADLLGESNKQVADAGSNAADMEMASLDSVKPEAKAKSKGVSREVSLKRTIAQLDKNYQARLNTAKSELAAGGEVREATRNAGLKIAADFKAANDQLASWYDGHGLASRAQVCRSVGESRVASADMAFNKIDSGKIDAYNTKQDALSAAVKAYLADAQNDLSPEERAQIKSSLGSRLQQLSGNLTQLVSSVMNLLNQVQSGASPMAAAGCAAKQVASGAGASDMAGSLLSPLTSLLSLVKGMASKVQGMLSDINAFG
jgi:hypothetical protein